MMTHRCEVCHVTDDGVRTYAIGGVMPGNTPLHAHTLHSDCAAMLKRGACESCCSVIVGASGKQPWTPHAHPQAHGRCGVKTIAEYRHARHAAKAAYAARKTVVAPEAVVLITKNRRSVRLTIRRGEAFAYADLNDAALDQLVRRLVNVRGGKRRSP